MSDVTAKIAAILKRYMRDPAAPVVEFTTLNELDIDWMDLPMISLDIEDAFGVQIPYDDEIDAAATVRTLVVCVGAGLAAKALQPAPRPRVKSTWLSTGAERRR
ncbi:MAG: acyl carrier protein [Hyphomicrobiaceae bacterium]